MTSQDIPVCSKRRKPRLKALTLTSTSYRLM